MYLRFCAESGAGSRNHRSNSVQCGRVKCQKCPVLSSAAAGRLLLTNLEEVPRYVRVNSVAAEPGLPILPGKDGQNAVTCQKLSKCVQSGRLESLQLPGAKGTICHSENPDRPASLEQDRP